MGLEIFIWFFIKNIDNLVIILDQLNDRESDNKEKIYRSQDGNWESCKTDSVEIGGKHLCCNTLFCKFYFSCFIVFNCDKCIDMYILPNDAIANMKNQQRNRKHTIATPNM